MPPTPFADKPTLTGQLVTLRPITSEDAVTIDAIIRDDGEIARLTGSVHSSAEPLEGMPIDDLREVYGRWATADDRLVLAVVDNETGAVVGEVVLNEWDEGNRSCNYRTLIGRAGRGRGLGTEATGLVVDHAIGTIPPRGHRQGRTAVRRGMGRRPLPRHRGRPALIGPETIRATSG